MQTPRKASRRPDDRQLQGKHYAQSPDRRSFRVFLGDLRREEARDRLRLVWTDPQRLSPVRRTAEFTREIAELLATLSRFLETRMIGALPDHQQPGKNVVSRRTVAEEDWRDIQTAAAQLIKTARHEKAE